MAGGRAPTVVGVGELLWDVFDDARRPGGAPANVAFHAGQLGCRAAVLSRVGQDADGDALLEHLGAGGLDLRAVQRDGQRATGRVRVLPGRDGERDYQIEEGAAWEALVLDRTAAALVEEADALCFGTLLQRSPVSERALFHALERNPRGLKVLDLNLRQHWWTPQRVRRSVRCCDVLKLSRAEAETVAPILGVGAQDSDLARRLCARHRLRAVCITDGARGCVAADREHAVRLPSVPVRLADPVGAGDAFTAAFVSAWLDGAGLSLAARFANRVGGLVAAHHGAMPRLEEPLARLREECLGGA